MRFHQLSLGILAGLVATVSASSASAQALQVTQIGAGFTSPLFVCSPPGDTHRLFVVEQTGRVKIIKDGTLLATPFINIDPLTNGGGEAGLLGMAFHPNYASNGKFYLSYTNTSGNSMIRQYQVSANPDVADAATFTDIFGPLTQPFSNHNGGCIQFGADGKLYAGYGDGGSANDPGNRAQNPTLLLGKILRFDVDLAAPYIPADNPFVGDASTDDLIWALGMRNPWRFSFDRQTGDLWIGDVGQGAREEVDFELAGNGGQNYGWRCMEGFNCTGLSGCTCNGAGITLPVHDYSHSLGCSITGGYRYRGAAMPNFVGRYFFGDYCSARVWSFDFNGTAISNLVEHTTDLAIPGAEQITSFGEDANGELYICDFTGGEIWRIEEECPGGVTSYCTAAPNSVGPGCFLGTGGSVSLSSNDFTLVASAAAPNKPGLFYYGPNQISAPFGDGFRCVGGGSLGIFRLSPPVTADAFGDAGRAVDFTVSPANSGPGMITAGSTWNFQFWYRDPAAGGSGFNLSNAVSATFCP
ncbi:MAG: PQQ-dependent sugar dehydrogenase [Planctomycetes bacterium]|nr:PQQ-dependent sugar dehydrogenase [Planctomycetota bacterium]